jgi:putative transposase
MIEWEGEAPAEPQAGLSSRTGTDNSETMDKLPQRSRPAHGVQIALGEPTIVWLTVCTKDRRPWLNCETAHRCLLDAWRAADAWLVGRYMIMPDHVHIFCSPGDLNITLESWVKYWKSIFSKSAQNPGWKWQSGYWDTRLRRHESYTEKWMYMAENPVRAGLVVKTEDWPYQGELNVLRW